MITRMKNMRPAVFLDRDGTLNVERGDYVKSWSEFEFLPGALGLVLWQVLADGIQQHVPFGLPGIHRLLFRLPDDVRGGDVLVPADPDVCVVVAVLWARSDADSNCDN